MTLDAICFKFKLALKKTSLDYLVLCSVISNVHRKPDDAPVDALFNSKNIIATKTFMFAHNYCQL